jgi:regulator of protease activity HflC (stomatin/prohibitin superfamily)
MKADHLSYQRATTVSLLGLGLQLVLGLGLLIYAVLAPQEVPAGGTPTVGDHAALSAAMMILLGSGVWLLLAVLFDQHRRERIEAMETEALFGPSGVRDGSVFNEKADDVRVAAKRLAWMHRVAVPGVSLLYAGGLIGLGLWRLQSARAYLETDTLKSPFRSAAEPGWAIGMGLGIAIAGFFFARYAAGMAKQSVWGNLRAGAAASVGAALLGFAYGVGHFVDRIGPDALARVMHVVVPGLMVVIGAEVVLNFLLGLYSPRRPGEFPRAACDSRILGFFAAPDRLAKSIGEAVNYQFGFDVTSSWFYQLMSRSLVALVLTGVAVLWLLTSVAVVQPNEQAIRVRLGEKIGGALGPGAYFKLPWPIERIERTSATGLRRLDLAGRPVELKNSRSVLWTNDHGAGNESYFPVQPTQVDREGAGGVGGAGRSVGDQGAAALDYALVKAVIPLYYRVEDLSLFESLASPGDREALLLAVGRREAARVLASKDLDALLGDGRDAVATRIREAVEARFGELNEGRGAGVRVLWVGVENIHPPKETAKSFENMVQATYDRASAVLKAETEANDQLIQVAGSVEKAREISAAIERLNQARREAQARGKIDDAARARLTELELAVQDLVVKAGGSAASAIQKARSDRWVRHMTARAQSVSYEGQIAGFRASPKVYAAQVYFRTLRDAMANSRLYIVAGGGGGGVEVRIDAQDINTGGNMFNRVEREE